MTSPNMLSPRWLGAFAIAIVLPSVGLSHAEEIQLEGYQTYEQFEASLGEIAKSPHASLKSIGRTAEGRDVHLLTLSSGEADAKPGILLMGSVDASNLVGSELTVRMAQALVSGDDQPSPSLLDEVTLYIIPRPSPDATERALQAATLGTATNSRSTDADRDGEVDEDPVDDLNGDGMFTMMRVEDPKGEWIVHPEDDRLMVKADAKKNQQGKYLLYTEGTDNDGDGQYNEDGPGGVDFNRNFPFNYPYFAGDAGPHQVSEPESRAVADFAYSKRNIFLVLSFAPQDNLTKAWSTGNDRGRIRTRVQRGDDAMLGYLASRYGKIVGKDNAPSPTGDAGAFVHWAYFHYGRWSIGTRGWWIPTVKTDEKPKDNRNAEERNALRWLQENSREGFVDWTKVEHPDFPGKVVEVGGFKPLLREHPPADELDAVAAKHGEFLKEVVSLKSNIRFTEAKAEAMGAGVYRIHVTVQNRGFLPTSSAMGGIARQLQKLQIELQLPKKATLLTGSPREDLGTLSGKGGARDKTWLVRLPEGTESIHLKAGEPSVGYCETTINLAGDEKEGSK